MFHKWFNLMIKSNIAESSSFLPELLPQPESLAVPKCLHAMNFKKLSRKRPTLQHFFMDDHFFETVWNTPKTGIKIATRPYLWATTTPDFSMYTDWHFIPNLWNLYRTRLVGRIWQDYGAVVIPTVNWTVQSSYEYCFLGIPQNQIVALLISNKQKQRPEVRKLFLDGYYAMIENLNPRHIIFFGKPWKEIVDSINKTIFIRDFRFPERWKLKD